MSIHSNGLCCAWKGKEVGFVEERFNGLGIRVLNPASANPTSFTLKAQNKPFE